MRVDQARATLVAALVVSTLAGCGTGSGADGSGAESCDHGKATDRGALDDFLAAARDDDRARAERVLIPGGTILDPAWEALGGELVGADLHEIVVSSERLGTARSFRVVLPSRDVLGDFEVHELEDERGCFGVVWGEYPPAGPSPSTSAT